MMFSGDGLSQMTLDDIIAELRRGILEDHQSSAADAWDERIIHELERLRRSSIYLVIVADHHADAEYHAFSEPSAAIAFAKKEVRLRALGDEFIESEKKLVSLCGGMRETGPALPDGWLYDGAYSVEDDRVTVRAVAIDRPEGLKREG
jgi:hypothetical protein